MTIDELASRMDQQFAGVNDKFARVEERSEELRDLMKFGLEARDVLRDQIHRRFDEADRKQDEQITLLKCAVRHSIDRK